MQTTRSRSALNQGFPLRAPLSQRRKLDTNCVHIGLVNNMPDTALRSTERQFRALLGAAAKGIPVRLSLFTLPGIPRSKEAQCVVDSSYSNIRELWNSRLDGLIVTGAEPVTSNLMHEPYWGSMRDLVDWAEGNTYSSIWSCLAAHAAVLKMDGIGRRRLPEKLSGVYPCRRASEDPLTADIPRQLRIPHSRWNEIPEEALIECGYRILTRSERAGADMFVKRRRSMFVFFQGHPEYDADSLSLEYRRDVRRFVSGQRDFCPNIPDGCFDPNTLGSFATARERALSTCHENLFTDFSTALRAAKVKNTWRRASVGIYRNWLLYLSASRQNRVRSWSARTEPSAA